MQSLKLAFYKGNKFKNPDATWLDTAICIATAGQYSHVELVYHLDYETKTAKCWGASPYDKGVRRKDILLNPAHWDIYTLDGIMDNPTLHEWYGQHEGKPYDYLGALGVKFRIFRQDNGKWFCSEILASYLRHKRPHRMSPIKLYRVLKPQLKKVRL